jgi:single-stranded DNA-binding protein
MNLFVAIGTITEAPKKSVKEETGTMWINFTLSVPTFEGKNKYEYIPCIAFGKTAERILNNFRDKFQKIGIEGYIVGHTVAGEGEKKNKLLKVVVKKMYYTEQSTRQVGVQSLDISDKDLTKAADDLVVEDEELPF